jgi:uncharacterized protein (TIGR02452 family)
MYNNTNNPLINEWYNTKRYFEDKKPPVSHKIDIKTLSKVTLEEKTVKVVVIEVVNCDSFELAIKYKTEGLNPLVLNMASAYKPGGGVANGRTAQEEELFRRSNAHQTHLVSYYPLKNNEVIYSPTVTIIKDRNYKKIKEVTVSMVACAAIKEPKLKNNQYSNTDYKIMYNKIEALFLLGIQKKHDSLVLGALGCGVYNNPPEEVADMFNDMNKKYGNFFKKIGYGILVVKTKDQDNLDIFTNILTTQ